MDIIIIIHPYNPHLLYLSRLFNIRVKNPTGSSIEYKCGCGAKDYLKKIKNIIGISGL